MPRVVRRIINHSYFQIKPELIIEGTIIPFDIYIKRFGDFVIIIDAGTEMTRELVEKLHAQEGIFALRHDSVKVKGYYAEHHLSLIEEMPLLSNEKVAEEVHEMRKKLDPSIPFEERLKTIYGTTVRVMQAVFESRNEILPLEPLKLCAESLVEIVDTQSQTFSAVVKFMPEIYTPHHHSVNVSFFAAALGRGIGLLREELAEVALSGLLHDIGKLRIDEEILLKPGSLEDDEFELVMRHSNEGYEILKTNGMDNARILEGVRYHHERMDGSGYPKRLKGKTIPKYARIVGICDAFDALTTRRTFRPRYSSYDALVLMKRDMASHFDEGYVDTFIRLLR